MLCSNDYAQSQSLRVHILAAQAFCNSIQCTPSSVVVVVNVAMYLLAEAQYLQRLALQDLSLLIAPRTVRTLPRRLV
jgi:hypothetical protein